jgi:hypothetical protein
MADLSFNDILEQMQPITLEEMEDIHLMDRVDSKFIVPAALLPELLEAMMPYFKVQVNNEKRVASYSTQYLDTPALDFFRMHEEGRLNRQKIRIRSYVDSKVSFLEVKNKNDRGRTRKIRVPVAFSHIQSIDELEAHFSFLEKYAIFDAQRLAPVLETAFDRITLVNHRANERVTLDRNLSFVNNLTGRREMPHDLLVLELKQSEYQPSDCRDILERGKIRQVAFSKYHTGTVLTTPALRRHRFDGNDFGI